MPDLTARYAAAVQEIYDYATPGASERPRPSAQACHIFDWPDGLRLIISRERFQDGRVGIHLSASVQPNTSLFADVQHRRISLLALFEVIGLRWQTLAGSTRRPEMVGVSAEKGVPHFVVWDLA